MPICAMTNVTLSNVLPHYFCGARADTMLSNKVVWEGAEKVQASMHELSIAYSLVEMASRAARDAHVERVEAVHMRLGVLAGVVKEALLFSYDIAAAGTILEGSRLEIESLPLVVYCPACDHLSTLPDVQSFQCQHCGALTADIRQGRELELESLEVADEQPTHP
jgi:hydrogenase nickel incorporation protein HypA/HybF